MENRAGWATKTDVAYRTVRDQILDGTLVPGSELEQEALTRQLGLSSTPLREALRRLEAEGLLRQVAHRKMRVPELSRRELVELYDVRLRLDPFAAALGAAGATDEDRANVRRLLEWRPAEGEHLQGLERNNDLHRAMYVASRNTVLIGQLDRLWERSDRYRLVLIRDGATAGVAEHEHAAIAEAFCAGDRRTVTRLVREHLAEGRDTLLARLSEGGVG